jgi:hypothetical protein
VICLPTSLVTATWVSLPSATVTVTGVAGLTSVAPLAGDVVTDCGDVATWQPATSTTSPIRNTTLSALRIFISPPSCRHHLDYPAPAETTQRPMYRMHTA